MKNPLIVVAILSLSLILLNVFTSNSSRLTPSNRSAVPSNDSASRSQVVQVSMHSRALNREMGLSIYLPPDYNPNFMYPTLYLLYGYGGNRDSWFSMLPVPTSADRLIADNRITPLIIVSPDYGNSFGVNSQPGIGGHPSDVDVGRYEDYLIQDVVPYVDSHYSTLAVKESRYIGGASMGGYAALFLGFTHPELFSKIGAHSAALWTYTASDMFTGQRDWLYANEALRLKRDPFQLSKTSNLKNMQVYLDGGKNDPLTEKDRSLYEELRSKQIAAQWTSNAGGHDLSYWTSQLDAYLLFYAGKRDIKK